MNEKIAIEMFGGNAVGLRPDIFPAVNTFIVLKKSRVFIKPRGKTQALLGDSRRMRRANLESALSEFDSRETELVDAIDHAMATGGTIPGFLALQKTPTGAIKAIPYKGAVIVAASATVLARLVDRELINPPSIMALLGLEKPVVTVKAVKKSAWARVSGGLSALKNSQ